MVYRHTYTASKQKRMHIIIKEITGNYTSVSSTIFTKVKILEMFYAFTVLL